MDVVGLATGVAIVESESVKPGDHKKEELPVALNATGEPLQILVSCGLVLILTEGVILTTTESITGDNYHC